MKKFIVLLCILFGLFCFPIQAKASELDIPDFEIEDLYSLLDVNREEIFSTEVIYDFCDEPSFFLVDFTQGGYAIVFRDFRVISERSVGEGAVNPYGTVNGKKYYAGPMCYFVYTDDKYIDILTDKEINSGVVSQAKRDIIRIMDKLCDDQQINDIEAIPKNNMIIEPFAANTEVLISNADVFNRIGFGENKLGTCGPIASQILLSYYAISENKNFVPSSWLSYPNERDELKIMEQLHEEMIKRMKLVLGGTVSWTVADGINAYFKANALRRGLMVTANSSIIDASYKIYKSISNDRPCIIFTAPISAYKYGKHVMVAYGYINYPWNTSYIVHTGWWNDPDMSYRSPDLGIEINARWITGCVTIDPGPSDKLEIMKTVNLKTYVNLSKKSAENEWTSSDTSIATVTNTGTVKAISAGSVIITHNNKALNEKTQFQIDCYIPVKTLKITKLTKDQAKALTVNMDGSGGGTVQLSTTLTPSEATYQTLHWVSSNNEVISVDDEGMVTVTGFGKAKITAFDVTGKKKAVLTLSTKYNPDSIMFNETTKELLVKKTYIPKITLTPKKNIDPNAKKDLVWSSGDTAVATVDAKGKITAVSNGNTTITATTKNGLSASVEISVVQPPTSLTIKPITASEKIMTVDVNGSNGSTLQLEKIFSPINTTNKFIWFSSDEKVLSVDQNGIVTALKTGKAKITVTDGLKKKKASIDLTVSHNPSSIKLTDTSKSIKIGITYTLAFIIEPIKTVTLTAKDNLTWSSSDTGIAMIDNKGKVTGVAEGTVTITVKTKNGKTATVQITVTK